MRELAARQLRLNRRRTAITLVGVILSVAMITAVAGFTTSVQDMAQSMFKTIKGDWHVAICFATPEQAEKILSDPLVEKGFTKPTYDENTIDELAGAPEKSAEVKASGGEAKYKEKLSKLVDAHVRLAHPTREYEKTAKQLAAKYGVQDLSDGYGGFDYNKELLATEGLLAGEALNSLFYTIAGILIFIIIFGSIMVISNAFTISANERIRQFGILKSVGATQRQVSGSVVAEGMILAAIGIPLGILVGFAVELGLIAVSNAFLEDIGKYISTISDAINQGNPLHFRFVLSLPAILVAAAASFLTIMLSAWRPARRAAKISAIEAIRMSNEIKIKPKKLRTSKLTAKLFGFEGALARKYLKRNSRAYRTTVASLVVGIMLYLVAVGFGAALTKIVDFRAASDMDANVAALAQLGSDDAADGGWDKSAKLNDDIHEAAKGTNTEQLDTVWKMSVPSESARHMLSNDMDKEDFAYIKDELTGKTAEAEATILLADAQRTEEYCRMAGIGGGLADGEAILVNTRSAETSNGITEISPFRYEKGGTIEVKDGDGKLRKLTLNGELNNPMKDIQGSLKYSFGMQMSLIVNERTFRDILAASDRSFTTVNIQWFAKSENASALSDAWSSLAEDGKAENIVVSNQEQQFAMTKSILALMMIFIYSFIAMLSLIGVTSVIGAISTNIRLRAREFAMLSSVGMTPQARRRMLNLESLFYGAKALMIGIPIGVFISWVIYHLVARQFGLGSFEPPWVGILVSIGAVFLLTFATMRYASNRLKGMNIVETLHDVNL
jgi:putative ABC transport system permease protein